MHTTAAATCHPLLDFTRALVARYLATFPAEQNALKRLSQQLEEPDDCFVRSNMVGHITTSAAVLSPDHRKVLLIHHKFLGKWLPPGGHYEEPGDLWDSATREVEEETGVQDLLLHPWCELHGIPFDIDTHEVPQNSAKGEGPHLHHDFRFLAVARSEEGLTPQLAEVHGVRWAPLTELTASDDRRLLTLARKLKELL